MKEIRGIDISFLNEIIYKNFIKFSNKFDKEELFFIDAFANIQSKKFKDEGNTLENYRKYMERPFLYDTTNVVKDVYYENKQIEVIK